MHTLHDAPATLALTGCHRLIQAASFVSVLGSLVLATGDLDRSEPAPEPTLAGSSCGAAFDSTARYPRLPELDGADVSGEPGVVLHLQWHRGVVELDGCFYELDRALEVDLAGLEQVSLLVELHGVGHESEVFVTDPSGGFETLVVQGALFDYPMSAETSLGFEVAASGQSAPTVPVAVAKPVDDDPPPN